MPIHLFIVAENMEPGDIACIGGDGKVRKCTLAEINPPPVEIPLLTRRETEIERMKFDGKKAREIATILGISRRTVEKHWSNIAKKKRVGISS